MSDSDSESDTYWEQKFPNDYEEILNFSKDSLMWTTKKELNTFSHRVPDRQLVNRFGEVLVITAADKFEIKSEVKSILVSPKTKYAVYLVYKLSRIQSTFEAPIEIQRECHSAAEERWLDGSTSMEVSTYHQTDFYASSVKASLSKVSN
ncbi:kinase-like domain, phloem protein 2-like protein [Tanacetum coccineum]